MEGERKPGRFLPELWNASQIVLSQSGGYKALPSIVALPLKDEYKSIWSDSLIFPAYATGLSVIILLLQLILQSRSAHRPHAKISHVNEDGEDNTTPGASEQSFAIAGHITQLGGPVIFAFRIARLLLCFTLLGISIFNVFTQAPGEVAPEIIRPNAWLQIAVCGVYGYTSLLALLSVTTSSNVSRLITRHLALVLAVVWGVYVYRDVWPLATFTLPPQDRSDGELLWIKIIVLTLAAVVVPLFAPRQYIPVDPQNPWTPIPEQTASIMSMMFFVWLDKTIMTAYRMPHMPVDKLPLLADYDNAEHLVRRGFKHLDPFEVKSDRHLFWGLMRVFRTEYAFMSIMVILQACGQLASPVAINQLLRYLETGGEDAFVRPWFWIGWLFLGGILISVSAQWYVFTTTRMATRASGMLTQLIFEHALRIRVKAEVVDAPASGGASVAAGAQGSASTSGAARTVRAGPSSSAKGKQKSKAAPEGTDGKKTAPTASLLDKGKDKNLVGKINNLVTSDLENLVAGRDFLFIVLSCPLQIAFGIVFLYTILGWSAFVGMATIILLFPLPGYVARRTQSVQREKMKKTDARVQNVTESVNVIRMIKLFGWESRVFEQLSDKREAELDWQWKSKVLGLLNGILNQVIPFVTMIATFFTYTVLMKKQLTASTVFSSMAVFEVMRIAMGGIFGILPPVIRAKVSLERVNEFLCKTELLDVYTQKSEQSEIITSSQVATNEMVGIRHAAFSWSSDNDSPFISSPMRRNFILQVDDEVFFRRGHINLIVGPTGSGKTSLLMALLGEMHYLPTGPDSLCNLPRAGGVAYAAQESWVQNETIRNNILFGAQYDEARYKKVIDQCGLQRDLSLFDAGDQTEVGEKGLTLSGGQKARITLARAVYSNAEILLLDDVLAALDVHTSRWIIDKCFKGDLIHGRTVLLVTHNVAMATPIAEFVVALGADGRILSQGSLSKALAKDEKLAAEVQQETEAMQKSEQEITQEEPNVKAKKPDGKLIVAEEVSVGHVNWPALKMFFVSLGGGHQFLFWIFCVGTLVLSELSSITQVWFLGYWARQYEDHDSSEVKASFYLTSYAMLLLGATSFYSIGYIFYVYGGLRASRSIHKTLVASILGTTLRWLDMTPMSRIIARCTQDIQAVDGSITDGFRTLMELSISMLVKLTGIVVISPLFLIPGVLIAVLGAWCGQIYMKGQLSVKREMSNARAPVLGHFGAAIAGLTSIRAYGAQNMFKKEAHSRIDRYTRVARTFYNLNRWVSIRVDVLSAVFSTSLATYLVYGGRFNASNTGFSLNMAVGLSGMILWWVRIFNQFEISGNSLERIRQYAQIEQEPKPTKDGIPPAYWPASGELKVEQLSARYSPDGPRVLDDISFEVKSGERVGIVGRTGSGKSTLTLSLLRCIITEGKVYYDGLPIDALNLDALRSSITIIPQVPELLSGTLRQNLDPFGQHEDAVLNDALSAAGLFSLQDETDEGRITLDSPISSGGNNLSVGQRQILALARAIVRQSKLLILDEATSAIDYSTDTIIQKSLRNQLKKDVTLLTVAHRLQTIMDADKVMVIDVGHIVEFGKPSELLKLEKGRFRGLVDESGDKEVLYAMAEGRST